MRVVIPNAEIVRTCPQRQGQGPRHVRRVSHASTQTDFEENQACGVNNPTLLCIKRRASLSPARDARVHRLSSLVYNIAESSWLTETLKACNKLTLAMVVRFFLSGKRLSPAVDVHFHSVAVLHQCDISPWCSYRWHYDTTSQAASSTRQL